EGRANRELALTAVRSHEDQVGDVRARDQQDQPRGRGYHPDRVGNSANDVVTHAREHGHRLRLIEEHLGGDARRQIRRHLEHARQPGFEFALRLVDRYPRLQSGNGEVVEAAGIGIIRIQREWKPELRLRIGKTEAPRHHADDLTRDAVDQDRATEDVRIGAEAGAPERFADDRDAGSGGRVLGVGEGAAEPWRDLEQGDEIRGDIRALQALRLAPSVWIGDVYGAVLIKRDTLDGPGESLVREVGARSLLRLEH